jgi:hypothetical protein
MKFTLQPEHRLAQARAANIAFGVRPQWPRCPHRWLRPVWRILRELLAPARIVVRADSHALMLLAASIASRNEALECLKARGIGDPERKILARIRDTEARTIKRIARRFFLSVEGL